MFAATSSLIGSALLSGGAPPFMPPAAPKPSIFNLEAVVDPAVPQDIIVNLAIGTVFAAFAVRLLRKKTPTWAALIVDLLPLLWMFYFAWSLVHMASDLMPARKHPPFNGNAFASAGLLAFIAALIPRSRRGLGVGIMGVLLSAAAFADMLHMRIFGNVIPIGSSGSATLLWDVRHSIASLVEKRDWWIALYLATAVVVLVVWRVKKIEGGRLMRAVLVATWAVPALALGIPFLPLIKTDVATFLDSKWAKEVLNREDQVWNAGFFEAHVREIALTTKHWIEHKRPSSAELDQVKAYYKEEHTEHYTDDRPSFGRYKGKNLLVIQIEAFEEWLIGAQVKGQEITPFLNRLRDHALYYPHMFNIVASSSTADCEYLFLNSNHPLPDGAVAFRREDNHFVTLATTLRDAGYSTLSMHAYRRGMWNRAVLHPRYGFTHSLFGEELPQNPVIGWGLDDHVFFPEVVKAVQGEKKPWFVYAITLSSHHPYNSIPYNQRRLRLGPLEGSMVGEYIHSAAFVDDALSQLFAQLRASDLLRDTVVVMYGDHDGHLKSTPRDRANLASMTNVPRSKTEYIGAGSWYLSRIPLFFLFPDTDAPAVAPVYGGQIDFAPTILHYLGIDPPRSFMGHPMLPEDMGGFVARWDGSFASPPLVFDAGLDECRDLTDLRSLPVETCRPLADRTRKELDASWLVTNNDLAGWLVKTAEAVKPVPPPAPTVTLGATCTDDKDCAAPAGYDPRCLGGVCMSSTHGACDRQGSTAPCALGSACYKLGSSGDVCGADCDVYRCAGLCVEDGVCVPRE